MTYSRCLSSHIFLHLSFCLLVALCCIPNTALAQAAVMPDNWQTFDDAQFVASYVDVFGTAPWPESDHQQEVMAHVWSTYLNDPAFIANGDRNLLYSIVDVTLRIWRADQYLPPGVTTDQREIVRQQLYDRARNDVIAGNADFAGLQSTVNHVTAAGVSPSERAQLTADWCGQNDLTAQNVIDLTWLIEHVNAPQMPWWQTMSARWEGKLNITNAGDHTFSRYLAQPHTDDWMKVWIDGNLVLDTTKNEAGEATVSQPVNLTAGLHDLRVDFSRDTVSVDGQTPRDVGHVELLLMWNTPTSGGGRQLVPASAFKLADGSGAGVSATYFSDAAFENVVQQRVESAIEQRQGSFAQTHETVLGELKDLVLEPSRWGLLESEEDNAGDWHWPIPQMAWVLTASEVDPFIAQLCQTRPQAVGRVWREWPFWSMLIQLREVPGDSLVLFTETWADNRPPFKMTLGTYPGWHWDGYLKWNEDAYAVAGIRLIRGVEIWPKVEQIQDQCLTRPDGSCNLEMLRFLIECHKQQPGKTVADLKRHFDDNILSDEQLTGDVRATWLVGRSVLDEWFEHDQIPNPLRGWSWMDEAFAEAQSESMRFWVLNEMVVRLIAIDEGDRAKSLLDSVQDQFTSGSLAFPHLGTDSPTIGEQIAEWRTKAEEYTALYADRRANAERNQKIARLRDDIAFLEKRKQEMEAQGRPAQDIAALNQAIAASEQELASLENAP